LGLLPIAQAQAEFDLNFTVSTQYELPGRDSAVRTYYWNSDNYWGTPMGVQTGTAGTPAQTPYLYDANSLERPQIVTDPVTGNTYYHMLFGDMADGFIQESYIQMGYGNTNTYGSDALGEPDYNASASGGHSVYNSVNTFGNGYDPLDMDVNYAAKAVTSGNGTANPNRVIIRQIMTDGEVMVEFHKDKYNYKPRISQIVNSPDITMLFDLDMRAIDYNTNNADAVVYNTMQLWQPGAGTSANFNAATDTQDANVTGGKFTYTDGSGFGGSEGSYSYAEGGYDQTQIEWQNYLDPYVYNPWAFEDGKAK